MNWEQLKEIVKGSGQVGREASKRITEFGKITHEETKKRYMFLYLAPVLQDCILIYAQHQDRTCEPVD
jgi:hypothetical protein